MSMCCGQRKIDKKRILLCVPVLLVLVFMAFAPIAAVADPADFITMYRDFFQNVKEKKYQKVWDAMTIASKSWIAKEIADAAVKMNKDVTQAQLYAMLEADTSNVRTNFFNNFNVYSEKTSLLSQILVAPYSVKSSTKERVVLTITLAGEPKDFQIIQEEGKWKINFFDDLSR